MKKYGVVLIFFAAACSLSGPRIDMIQKEIRTVIERQQKAWNAHDIEGFMTDYWKSEEMTYQSGNNRLEGWDALLERYKTNYAGEKMGELVFSDIEIKALTKNHAFALGRWSVQQGETSKEGLFTIILKRFPDGWKIIHDQS